MDIIVMVKTRDAQGENLLHVTATCSFPFDLPAIDHCFREFTYPHCKWLKLRASETAKG